MRISDWSSDLCSSDLSCGDAAAIVQAAGLTIADLFPERLAADTHEDRQRRRRLAREAQWGAALEVVQHEARVVAIAAGDIAYGRPVSVEDYQRLCEAVEGLAAAAAILTARQDDVRGRKGVGNHVKTT